jgi:hypothetical protein
VRRPKEMAERAERCSNAVEVAGERTSHDPAPGSQSGGEFEAAWPHLLKVKTKELGGA